MMWLLTALGAVRRALSALWGLARANPALAAVVLLAGLSGWLWYTRGEARDERDAAIAGRKADRAAYTAAQAEALRLALAAKAATEARYKAHAERIDSDHETELADARDATTNYIVRNRVRAQGVAGSCSGTLATASDRGSGVPESLSAGVVMGEADVRACGDLYPYAVKAHEWAKALQDDGR